jgi:hypothetical protein
MRARQERRRKKNAINEMKTGKEQALIQSDDTCSLSRLLCSFWVGLPTLRHPCLDLLITNGAAHLLTFPLSLPEIPSNQSVCFRDPASCRCHLPGPVLLLHAIDRIRCFVHIPLRLLDCRASVALPLPSIYVALELVILALLFLDVFAELADLRLIVRVHDEFQPARLSGSVLFGTLLSEVAPSPEATRPSRLVEVTHFGGARVMWRFFFLFHPWGAEVSAYSLANERRKRPKPGPRAPTCHIASLSLSLAPQAIHHGALFNVEKDLQWPGSGKQRGQPSAAVAAVAAAAEAEAGLAEGGDKYW